MAKDIFVLIQYNKATNKFDINFFPDALDAKEFQANLIQAAPGEDLVFNSFIVNEFKKKVSQPNIFFYKKPSIISTPNIKFGLLYNSPAASHPLLAPNGWHVPSSDEFIILNEYLCNNGFKFQNNGYDIAKSIASKSDWDYCEIPGTVGCDLTLNNSAGLNLLPAGQRSNRYNFRLQYSNTLLWSSSPGVLFYLDYNIDSLGYNEVNQANGCSIRLIRDLNNPATSLKDLDNNYYTSVTIGTQTWLLQNWACTKFNDGTPIPNVTDNSEWNNLTTPAYCQYNNSPVNVFI